MREAPLLLALGSNLAGPWGSPAETLAAALARLPAAGVAIERVSRLHETAPMGPVPQDRYANAAAAGRTALAPLALLAALKALEGEAGRRPGPRWGPRQLDLDILDIDGQVLGWERPHDPLHPAELVLPHPELHRRRFVLAPLCEVAPDWRHPVLGQTARELLATLPPDAA